MFGRRFRRVAHDRVPALRRPDDVVVELDQISLRDHLERRRVRVLADVSVVMDDLDARVLNRIEVLTRPVGRAVVPDHDLPRRVRRHAQDVLDALAQEVDAVVS